MDRDLLEPISFASLQAAACGHREPSGTLVDFIYRRAAVILGTENPDVDEAASDAYMNVIHAVREGRFDPTQEGKPSSWVATIAVRVAIDYRRRAKRQVEKFESYDDESDLHGHDLAVLTDPAIIIDARSDFVQTVLSAIDADHRAVILLRYWDGLSYDEIARALHVPIGTVKSRIHRAEAQLQHAAAKAEIAPHRSKARRRA